MPSSVILWWGSDVRILGEAGIAARTLEEKEDPVAAILAMMAGKSSDEAAARIIYHPATLDVREIACPDLGRTRLQRILSAEFGVLKAPGTLWSAESIRRGSDGHGTVLYIDARSQLPRLVDGLARRGIRTEGAWPLQTLVEATPPCDRRKESFLGVIAVGGRALVSCVDGNGHRLVRFQEGPDFADTTLAEIGTALALFEDGGPPPALRMIEDGPKTAVLRDRLGSGQFAKISLADFLDRARLLAAGGLSDFIPRPSPFGRAAALPKLAAGIGLILMAGSGWSARATWKNQERSRKQAGAFGEQRLRLRAEVASGLAARDERDRLGQSLGRMECPPQRHYELMAALARFTPNQIVLREVTAQGNEFTIRGHCGESAGGTAAWLSAFRRDLASDDLPWKLLDAAPAPAAADSDFTIRGLFR